MKLVWQILFWLVLPLGSVWIAADLTDALLLPEKLLTILATLGFANWLSQEAYSAVIKGEVEKDLRAAIRREQLEDETAAIDFLIRSQKLPRNVERELEQISRNSQKDRLY